MVCTTTRVLLNCSGFLRIFGFSLVYWISCIMVTLKCFGLHSDFGFSHLWWLTRILWVFSPDMARATAMVLLFTGGSLTCALVLLKYDGSRSLWFVVGKLVHSRLGFSHIMWVSLALRFFSGFVNHSALAGFLQSYGLRIWYGSSPPFRVSITLWFFTSILVFAYSMVLLWWNGSLTKAGSSPIIWFVPIPWVFT